MQVEFYSCSLNFIISLDYHNAQIILYRLCIKEKTGSTKGAAILKDWEKYLSLFWQLVPPSEEDTPEANAKYDTTTADQVTYQSAQGDDARLHYIDYARLWSHCCVPDLYRNWRGYQLGGNASQNMGLNYPLKPWCCMYSQDHFCQQYEEPRIHPSEALAFSFVQPCERKKAVYKMQLIRI